MDRNLHRQGANPHLKELYLALSSDYQRNALDGFGLYLFAVVLRRLGYSTSAGSTSAPPSAMTPASATARYREDFAEEQKRQQLPGYDDRDPATSTPLNGARQRVGGSAPFNVTTRFVLIESIRRYPWNWSAWMELVAHSPFTSSVSDRLVGRIINWWWL